MPPPPPPPPLPAPQNEAEQQRALGEAACARDDWGGAIQHFSAALDSLVPAERLVTEPPRRAAYHVSRAEAYLARAQAGLALRDGERPARYQRVSSRLLGLCPCVNMCVCVRACAPVPARLPAPAH